ncbi:MAG: hypothetical protein ACQKBV_07235 [Puniceicoccales bacterium]
MEFRPQNGEATIIRPLAVVDRDWAVCQITVGAFTAEDFSDLTHEACVPVDYYVALQRSESRLAFSANDPRWRAYERLHGDVIHPHVMASDLGYLDPGLAHGDPNWETLSRPEIERRLIALQDWWSSQGYQPLNRIATYTPCNPLVQACKAVGIRVIHSLCSEQNWSDGAWAINHWGMPTAPYWIAADDFRKAGSREETGVMGIIMNHYQVLLPHLTRWGDFVLSPSHFTRWIRAADSGEESTRFRQFLQDTVRGGSSMGESPFFFVAGFEFGRSFGTANMTAYNRAGLKRLLELAEIEKLVFATSTDVRAYFDRRVDTFPDRVFRQRDNWVGVTVNDKPGQAGDSVVLERSTYKALICEGSYLPYFYYDYTVPWAFATDDTEAPDDYAPDCERSLRLEPAGAEALTLSAEVPLARAIPIALWDQVVLDACEFLPIVVKGLEDGRNVSVLEVPAGWSGRVKLTLRPVDQEPGWRSDGRWKLQRFGVGADQHTYLYLDAPIADVLDFPVRLKRSARVDCAKGYWGELEAGEHQLSFGFLQGWYRFWGCSVKDIEPASEVNRILEESGALIGADAAQQTEAHFHELDARAWAHPSMQAKVPALSVHCGAKLSLGSRSRAAAHDESVAYMEGLSASEFADGVMAYGPGKAFWYHPRGLHFRVFGLRDKMKPGERWILLLNSFDPQQLNACYDVSFGVAHRKAGQWALPLSATDSAAFFPIEFTVEDLDGRGQLSVSVRSNQKSLVHWWEEGGFIAAVHAIWLGK